MSILTFIILIAAIMVAGIQWYQPDALSGVLGESKDGGMGWLASTAISILFIVITESISAVAYLFTGKDLAQSIYDKSKTKK